MAQLTFRSGLSRGWTPSLFSNRIAMMGWLASLVVLGIFAAVSDHITYFEAASSSIVVFLGWAVGRELDPDHHWVGALAMLGTFGAVFIEIPAGWTVGAALLTFRIVTGSTGRWLATFDLLFAAVIGYGSGGDLWSWPIAIAAGISIVAFREFGKQRWLFIGTIVVAFAAGWYLGDLQPINVDTEQLLIAGGVAAVTVAAVWMAVVTSRTDRPSGTIALHRVRYSRLAAGVFALSAVLVGGTSAFWSVAVLPAALTAVAVWNLGRVLRRFGSDDADRLTSEA